MNRKKNSGIIAIIIFMSFLIPPAQAPNIQVSPTDTTDDAFITGIGEYFDDTPFLYLRDRANNIVIGTRFRNVAIPQGSKINNATLFVRSIYDYGAANNITVTITGDDSDDSAPFNDSGSFSRTFTLAFEVWNISDVNGNQWNNVSVTGIVQEIIDRIGWTSGNSLSLVIFTDRGGPIREFVSVDGNPAHTAYIDIFFDEVPITPQGQAGFPYNETEWYDWIYNDTYRGIDIWTVNDINRTGSSQPGDVNWARVNMTELIEIDSGAAIIRNNGTWASLSGFQAQQWNSIYNDTGSLDVEIYFARFGINISGVSNPEVFNDRVATVAGISTATPVGGAGLMEGAAGNFVGLVVTVDTDDDHYSFRMMDRSGVNRQYGSSVAGFSENDGDILWFEYLATMRWSRFSIYSDREFQNRTVTTWRFYGNGELGPFRYPQLISSLGFGLTFINQAEYYTLLRDIEGGSVTFITYPNGTLADPDPLDDEEDPENVIDEILGGAQPEDPQEDVYTVIGKFQWKLLVLAVGMIMLLGSPIAGVYYGGDTATWIKILFIMFFGIGILWQIKSM